MTVLWRLRHPVSWRDVRRYQRTLGRRSYTAADIQRMLNDPDCPVRERPKP